MQTYSYRISSDSSSDGCSLPASTRHLVWRGNLAIRASRTVGGTLSTGLIRVTHGNMRPIANKKAFCF
ncbi:MAG: hypothetical protein ACRC11_14480 [Xenococcaceae cyanobacterium]